DSLDLRSDLLQLGLLTRNLGIDLVKFGVLAVAGAHQRIMLTLQLADVLFEFCCGAHHAALNMVWICSTALLSAVSSVRLSAISLWRDDNEVAVAWRCCARLARSACFASSCLCKSPRWASAASIPPLRALY